MKTRSAALAALWLMCSPFAAMAQGVVPTIRVLPPSATTLTDRSGSITLGGTAQTISAANPLRQGFCIQNQSSGDLWLGALATAVPSQPSMWLPPGAYYCPPAPLVGAISLYGALTGQAFFAQEW